jgi:transposase
MSRKKRKFSKEFKLEAVRLSNQDDKSLTEVSQELGVSQANLSRWREEFSNDSENSFPGKGRQKPVDAELRRLRKENADLKQEKEILKKAIAIFSKLPQK